MVLIVLTHPLRATCQPACPLPAPPNSPRQWDKRPEAGEVTQQTGSTSVSRSYCAGSRGLKEQRTAEEQVLGAEGAGGVGADGVVWQALR